MRQLVEGLGDTRGMMRLRIAETLGEIGEPAVPFLCEGLASHENPVVRRAVAKTLTLIADPSTVPNLLYALLNDEDTVVKGSSVGAMARIGEPAVQALLEILAEPDRPESMKGHAAWALAFMGSEAKDLVFKELHSTSPTVRAAVVGVLSKVAQEEQDEEAYGLLIQALDDEDVNVRCEAAAALGNAAYAPAGGPFRAMLDHEDWETRKAAALGLMKIGDGAAIAPLKAALAQESEDSIQPIYTLAISQLERQLAMMIGISLFCAIVLLEDPAVKTGTELKGLMAIAD
ncbi:MAG: HEAT repeat domain-containing protein [Acaryochloridaceae cyanobacterium RL_2_7]|nr:HEAT repeat domain-containing protein [Acaryochloridaceae cyanobacterium RL_2_7]